MAKLAQRLEANVAGDFFVDDTCIDCAACRWIAPATFGEHGDYSDVHAQPATAEATERALLALVACPTGSIGTRQKHDLRPTLAKVPEEIAGGVHHCGFHAASSFGAASWLIVREAGNVLIDSPRYAGALAQRIVALGGARTMFLTHQDDIADHEKWAHKLGCRRVMHARDAAGLRIEDRVTGDEPIVLDDELTLIPTPGHTAGSACLHYSGRFLFSGDHLMGTASGELYASRGVCWHDWSTQVASLERLLDYPFEWLLPGHGWPVHKPATEMRRALETCLANASRR